MQKLIIFFSLSMILITGCATTDTSDLFTSSTQSSDIFESVPKSSKPEAKYGYAVYLEMLSFSDIIATGRVNDTVGAIGESLQRFVERGYFPYTFTVIDDQRVYATSTPGGFVYLSKGMVDFCPTDDHLAAVIAHELAHIQHRRMRYTLKKRLADLAVSTSGYSSFVLGPTGAVVPKGMRLVNNVLLREKSRLKRTIVADRLAAGYLIEAGFDPRALREVVESLATIEGSQYHRVEAYIKLRPIDRDRIRQLKEITAFFETVPDA
jgi:beta-barrel assembly-enhancing protease